MLARRVAAALVALWLSAPVAGAAEKFEAGLLGSPNSAGWIWYIAQAEGFFAKANLEPDIIYVPTPSGLMQQLAAGSLDTVEIGVVEPIHAIARGAPVAILRIMGAVPPYEMVANVKTVKELKGKTIVIGGLGRYQSRLSRSHHERRTASMTAITTSPPSATRRVASPR